MPSVEFEPIISAGERQQTYVVDRASNGTGNFAVSNEQSVVTYVLSTCFNFYQFILREELQTHASAANSVKAARVKI
jgi:predicted cupin superfamily sugar epimerase